MRFKMVYGKKILAFFLMVIMMTGLLPPMTLPVQAADEVCGVLQSDGTIFETDAGNIHPTTKEITDKKTVTHLFTVADVTEISAWTFYDCSGLTTVDLTAVTTIGPGAFYMCSGLTTVNLTAVTTIGENAFSVCSSLTTINLAEVKTIGERAFAVCSGLTTLNMPAVITISNQVFSGCSGLTTVGLPIVTSIGDTAIGAAVTTGADGGFIINNVPNGSYDLVVSKNGNSVTTSIIVNNADYTLPSPITLAETEKPIPQKGSTTNPKTGSGSPFGLPASAILGLSVMGLGIYLKGKEKQSE